MRRRPLLILSIGLAVCLVSGVLAAYEVVIVPGHQACIAGLAVAVENHTLTPEVLVNSPFLGTGSGTYLGVSTSNLSDNGPIVQANNGSVSGNFEDFRWTIRQAVHEGTSNVCAGQFFLSATDNFSGGTQSLGWELHNDSTENESIGDNGTGYAIIELDNSFTKPTGSVSTCDSDSETLGFTSSHYSIRIPFLAGGVPETVTAQVDALVSYVYTFPADSGTWQLDNLSAPGGPGGGWAFSYTPCG